MQVNLIYRIYLIFKRQRYWQSLLFECSTINQIFYIATDFFATTKFFLQLKEYLDYDLRIILYYKNLYQ